MRTGIHECALLFSSGNSPSSQTSADVFRNTRLTSFDVIRASARMLTHVVRAGDNRADCHRCGLGGMVGVVGIGLITGGAVGGVMGGTVPFTPYAEMSLS